MTPPFTPPFTSIGSFDDLCGYLQEEGVAHSADALVQTTEIPTSSGPLVGAMYVRWELAMPLVQVIQLAVVDVPAERLAAVEHTLALLNHAAPLAGFALDHERRFIYFRITLLRDERDSVGVPQLNRALRAAVVSARDYLPLLREAAQAPVSPDPDPAPAPGPG